MNGRRTVVRIAKEFVPSEFKRRVKTSLGVPSVEWSLANMRRNGFQPRAVIDVGAYHGDWTKLCKRAFPQARVLMVEPQAALWERLQAVATECPDVALAPVLLGADEKASVAFYQVDSASSVLPEAEVVALSSVQLPLTTLSSITAGTPFERPDFLKLDVQGYELEVLKGADRAVESAEAVLMEVNLLALNAGAPLFDAVVAFMALRDLRLYDVCTFIRRPYDLALWQVDAIFVKSWSPLVSSKRWS